MKKELNKALDRYEQQASFEKSKRVRATELEDLRYLLALPQGRRFIHRILAKAHCFSSIFDEGSRVYYNAGWQDAGFFVMSEVEEAGPEFMHVMLREALSEKQRAAIEIIEQAEGLRLDAANRGIDTED